MAVGFGVLKLSPQAFWSMTPRELASAITGLTGRRATHSAPTRQDLSALMQRFPDQRENSHD